MIRNNQKTIKQSKDHHQRPETIQNKQQANERQSKTTTKTIKQHQKKFQRRSNPNKTHSKEYPKTIKNIQKTIKTIRLDNQKTNKTQLEDLQIQSKGKRTNDMMGGHPTTIEIKR